MKGLFLVLEGGDGSGKSSQLRLLEAFFRENGRSVEAIHFPRLEVEPYGPLIAEFLRGEFGPFNAVHPKLTALLYALDRREAAEQLRAWRSGNRVIVADRYLHSNIAYQCAKLEDEREQRKLAEWIENIEYGEHRIPRPDITLYLDVPDEFSRANLASAREGADREYLRGGEDIHEASGTLQEKVRREFRRMAEERPDEVVKIDCAGPDGGIASREEIHLRILGALRGREIIS